jgi:hypothetical protein
LATSTTGISISFAIGIKSRRGSIGEALGKCGLITKAPVAAIARVSPSGAALATVNRPSEPPAPALFSTTTCRLRRLVSSAARILPMPSAEAPGANGTMICIGFCAVCVMPAVGSSSVAISSIFLASMPTSVRERPVTWTIQ